MNHACRCRMLLALIFTLGGWHLAAFGSPAKELEVSRLEAQSVSLTQYFAVLEDKNLQLTLADVQKADIAARFNTDTPAEEAINFGYTPSANWLRLVLRNDSAEPVERILEISYAMISHLQFHQPLPSGHAYQSIDTGNAKAFTTRPYPKCFFVFPLILPPHSKQVYYMRLQSSNATIVPAKLWEPQAFYKDERNIYLIQAWYFGMVIAMILFNLLLAVLLRDTIYLRYILYMTTMALAICAEKGLTAEYLWPHTGLWSEISADVLQTFAMGGMLMFMREMLDTPVIIPRIDRILKLIIGLHGVFLIGLIVAFPIFAEPATVLAETAGMAILATGLFCAFKRQRSAVFFLGAFTPFIVGGILISLRTLGFLPTNIITVNGIQFGSALEMLLLAFALADRFNHIMRGRELAQKEALEAQQHLLENLQSSERLLEERVTQRTTDLSASNSALSIANHELHEAYHATETSRRQAEQARQQATQAMDDLHAAETQLVHSEKMAALGQLVSGIADEINVPILTLKSSGKNIASALKLTFINLPTLFRVLNRQSMELFLALINRTHQGNTSPSQATRGKILQQLEEIGVQNAHHTAKILIQLNVETTVRDYLPLMQHDQSELIMDTAYRVATIIHSTDKINSAVDQVSKVVFALKSFSHFDPSETKLETALHEGVETILTIHQNQFKHDTKLVRQYEPIPALACLPSELNQVWNNLIQNALYAMGHKGTLTIGIRRLNNHAVVSFGDTGCGIELAIREKIFDAFFTTKGSGQSNGLGLTIVKKIIDKHQGKILVESDINVGTTVSVHLPYLTETKAAS